MKNHFPLLLAFVLAALVLPSPAHAWGRHDLITRRVLEAPQFEVLQSVHVAPESIDLAAPDLLKRVLPSLLLWCAQYHRDHDIRYKWVPPSDTFLGTRLSGRKALLWELEDNIQTPLVTGPEKTAAEILTRYVEEPDGELDGGLNQAPYLERLLPSMSFFYEENTQHTHAFRHYYVTSSLLPPILQPKGIAPYRAALYAKLAEGAFSTGHPYWGYRFLAWSIHYLQDVTQPWHTVFLPGASFLSFSKASMRHEVASLHYLTEAFADTWLHQVEPEPAHEPEQVLKPSRRLASLDGRPPGPEHPTQGWDNRAGDPWFVAQLTEGLAKATSKEASGVFGLSRSFFRPVVDFLDKDLRPSVRTIFFGGLPLSADKLDFSGNGEGATEFLSQIWDPAFGLKPERDELLGILIGQIDAAVLGSRRVISRVLRDVTVIDGSTRWLCPLI